MRRVLVVGGASGIGLSLATEFAKNNDCEKVYIVDKALIPEEHFNNKFEYHQFDLTNADYSIFSHFDCIDTLMITAGFGKLALFKDIDEQYIISSINVNTISVIRIIHYFYDKLLNSDNFYCGIMGSISGFMSSPFFSVYAASKAALKIFIESVNVELVKSGSNNRILNISPGSIKGTSFYNGPTKINELRQLASDIIQHLKNKDDIFIPLYEEIYKDVLKRYNEDFRAEGLHSYEYKSNSIR